MINQMSSSMRNFMEAYSAVHNKEAKEEFYSHKDEISEMDFSLINQTELNDIAEEVLEELFEEGYSVEQCEAIFEEVLTEARVTYGSDTESPRAKKMSAVKSSLKGAMGKVKEKAAKGAVKSYGAYRDAKQSATDKANRLKQGASNASAQTMRKAKDAKAGIKSGIKGMIGKAAKKVGDAANKVSSRMSEGTVRKDVGDIYQAIYEKKADKDYDGDGKVESGKDEYFGSKDKAIKKAMGKKGECEKCGKEPCECDTKKEGYMPMTPERTARVDKAKKKAYDMDMRSQSKGDAKGADKQFKRRMAMDSRTKMKKEELEHLDELSKGTMGSYVKKASKDVEKRSYSQGEDDAGDAEIGYPGQTPKDKKIDKRQKGIGRAVDKMTRKEGVEFSEAELEAIQAKVDAWDVEEGYQRNPEKAEAMKKQMRAVGLNV
jgi:hypothetical protein